MMIPEIFAAVQSVKVLKDLVIAARDLKNFTDIITAVSEVQSKLMEAQSAMLSAQEKDLFLTNRVSELEKEIRELKEWKSEAERYQLANVSPPGTYAFILKVGMECDDPPHMICANCFKDDQISILQFFTEIQGVSYFRCHKCSSEIKISKKKTPFSFLK